MPYGAKRNDRLESCAAPNDSGPDPLFYRFSLLSEHEASHGPGRVMSREDIGTAVFMSWE